MIPSLAPVNPKLRINLPRPKRQSTLIQNTFAIQPDLQVIVSPGLRVPSQGDVVRSIECEVRGVGPEGAILGVGAERCVAQGKVGGKCFDALEVENNVLVVCGIAGAVFPIQILAFGRSAWLSCGGCSCTIERWPNVHDNSPD